MSKTLEQLTKDVDYLLDVVKKQDEIIKQLQDQNNTKVEDLLSCSELSFIGKNKETETVNITPNQKRKQIIDEAKKLLSDYVFNEGDSQFVIYNYAKYRVEFNVNCKKRTVEVLLIPIREGEGKTLREVAKCLPEDVWNDYVGKAIALGKVMNLDINTLLSVENPDGIVEGMIVELVNKKEKFTITHKNTGVIDAWYKDNGLWNFASQMSIVDDTNAEYNFQ